MDILVINIAKKGLIQLNIPLVFLAPILPGQIYVQKLNGYISLTQNDDTYNWDPTM